MNILISKFGNILNSRKDGKEAYLAIQPLLREISSDEDIIIDFEGVLSLSPSWGDEFITPLKEKYNDSLKLKKSSNSSVVETLKLIGEIHNLNFSNSE